MSKNCYIAEKPSVAREFANVLHENFSKKNGYMESENSVVTWCVGHLVTMSYPESYDPELKRWTERTLPFIPTEYKYEVPANVKDQFEVVKSLLHRPDISTIYICTDSGREGEYIYRLVDMMAQVPADKIRKRVWINSQTEEEVQRGIREALDWSAYDNLSDAAYLRAKEDYLMGINFSRILTLRYGNRVGSFLKKERGPAIAVGRVMTCVLGMIVRREREIRDFVKTPFYRVVAATDVGFEAEFRAVQGSKYFENPCMYKENGFKKREDAEKLIADLSGKKGVVDAIEKKKENRNAPPLFNLAEAQAQCSKLFKISPDETLKIIQELYEKKLVTYPRTDARVLSTAVAKEIYKNIKGLTGFANVAEYANEIMEKSAYKGLEKNKRYVDDSKITDHYAIIPTGQGLNALNSLNNLQKKVYELICRRFLSIFYPPAVYQKLALTIKIGEESFFASFKIQLSEGYQKVANLKKADTVDQGTAKGDGKDKGEESEDLDISEDSFEKISGLKKGAEVGIKELSIKEGETSPPKRYDSAAMIKAMESAGQQIEDEELRAQIKSSGIGTSATRAEILAKLVRIEYISLNQKTQIYAPTKLGEAIYEVVALSISQMLRPDLTASWEKGLTQVAEGEITERDYMEKLSGYVTRMTERVKMTNNAGALDARFNAIGSVYK